MDEPISLSDDELETVMNVAQSVHHFDRSRFLASVANMLRQDSEMIGPGSISRISRLLLASGEYRRTGDPAVGGRVQPLNRREHK
jgi:hypothetical protein